MSEPETYYAVMGVSPGATPDEIRRRYRELARKLHPDLNPDLPDASERLLRVNEAYNILSDPVRRASYDLTLRDRARRTATARAAAAGWAPASSGVRGAPAPDARRQQELERQRQEIQKKLEEARQAYARGHLGEARRLCEEILSVRRVGAASELLGDVYSRQGR
ncbi:MAG: J domain-containing protein, partial [Armatimonadetes bacterium]|nr:J domain-containing protein [Armatimonadota bacterium]